MVCLVEMEFLHKNNWRRGRDSKHPDFVSSDNTATYDTKHW